MPGEPPAAHLGRATSRSGSSQWGKVVVSQKDSGVAVLVCIRVGRWGGQQTQEAVKRARRRLARRQHDDFDHKRMQFFVRKDRCTLLTPSGLTHPRLSSARTLPFCQLLLKTLVTSGAFAAIPMHTRKRQPTSLPFAALRCTLIRPRPVRCL